MANHMQKKWNMPWRPGYIVAQRFAGLGLVCVVGFRVQGLLFRVWARKVVGGAAIHSHAARSSHLNPEPYTHCGNAHCSSASTGTFSASN